MLDRKYVEKAAESGGDKVTLLTTDPLRYLARSILAGMYLSRLILGFGVVIWL